jgi:hypothetical protein
VAGELQTVDKIDGVEKDVKGLQDRMLAFESVLGDNEGKWQQVPYRQRWGRNNAGSAGATAYAEVLKCGTGAGIGVNGSARDGADASKSKTVGARADARNVGDLCRGKTKDTITFLGDSLVRNVGASLEHQLPGVVTVGSKSGAKIEQVMEEVQKLPNSDSRHLVVLVGTNNLKTQGTETIRKKFDDLVAACKQVQSRKVTVVGIPKR